MELDFQYTPASRILDSPSRWLGLNALVNVRLQWVLRAPRWHDFVTYMILGPGGRGVTPST